MPCSSSHRSSARANPRMPWKPSRASTRLSRAGTRTDLDATRIGVPPARRTRSSAFASKASRSTAISGVASGSSCAATASFTRAQSRFRSTLESEVMLCAAWSRDAALAQERLDLCHLRVDIGEDRVGLPALALVELLALRLLVGLGRADIAVGHEPGYHEAHDRDAGQNDSEPRGGAEDQPERPVADRVADPGDHLKG